MLTSNFLEAAKLATSPDYHRLVILLIDEMHVKEDLVYDKHSGRMIGFVDLGNINNHLSRFEQSLTDDEHAMDDTPILAKSMVAFMVRGLFTTLWLHTYLPSILMQVHVYMIYISFTQVYVCSVSLHKFDRRAIVFSILEVCWSSRKDWFKGLSISFLCAYKF